ncbi:hypothetical protein WJX72_003684 [[Myrmecia] bisecta]|uniref:Uncharacterized protein n=1 Tax=[Myrmecia] bisecta TaxID=41462 RepID=A0AAW1QEQ8_9CHLO
MSNTFIDAHCHLQDPRLSDRVDAVLRQAHEAGVQRFMVNGTREEDWAQVEELAAKYAEIIPNFGLHPWYVQSRSEQWLHRLEELLVAHPGAGLGECGLDKARGDAPMKEQEAVLRDQINLGKRLQRPISVHCVKAFGKLQEMLQQLGAFPHGLILHSWIGPAEMVRPLAAIEGVYFSLSGHITRQSHDKAAAMVAKIPLHQVLLGTSSPSGFPRMHNPEASSASDQTLNHPANIRLVLQIVAEMSGHEEAEIAAAALDNSIQLFPPG